jgi:signal transduction histidine kinase
MTLVNRVSAFFLAALAVFLIGYSIASYLLVRNYLYTTCDRQLSTALNVLVAAIEVESDGVKWQPSDHTIVLGNARENDEVRWLIVNELGEIVDRSANLQREEDALLVNLASSPSFLPGEFTDVETWRVVQQSRTAPEPKPVSERDIDESADVRVLVARDMAPIWADLTRLAILLTALPVSLWLLAAGVGRLVCRRALAPVGSMARQVESMTAADFDRRLAVSDQRDELSTLAIAFNGLLERLQRAFQQQRRFAADAAHQLRTPLTVLRGELDVALRRPRQPEDYQRVLATLRDQTSELQQIVESLLFLAHAEAGEGLPDSQTIHWSDWLPEYLTHWSSHPRADDLRLELIHDASLSTSTSLLRQVLDNLVSNAFKYSESGRPVLILADAAGREATITVKDEGCGISPEDQQSIFDPFFRSAKARNSGIHGTGIGLAIVDRIASALSGRVTVGSRPGAGSRFTLSLPGTPTAGPSAASRWQACPVDLEYEQTEPTG